MLPKTYFFFLSIIISSSYSFAQVPELDWPIEIVSQGHGFTEGPTVAPDGQVYFSDMDNEFILRFNPATGTTIVWQNKSRKSNGLYILDNSLYACEAGGRSVVRYDLSIGPDSREVLVSKYQEDSLRGPNDLTFIGDDLFFSDFSGGRAYSMSINGQSLDTIPFNFENPNGIFSSQDGKQLYFTDFGTDKLYKADVINGQVGPVRLVVDLTTYELSDPDGLAVSEDGHIFQALYGSEKVVVIAPDGNVIGYLPTGPRTSNCVFAEDGKTLYITADMKLMRVVIPRK